MSAYYHLLKRTNDTDTRVTLAQYQSTVHAQGAWNDHEQHVAPITGLICHEMEQYYPREHIRMGRISIDVLGIIPFGEIEVKTHTIRGGRTIELIETTVSAEGRTHVIARAWRMLMSDTSEIQGVEDKNIVQAHELPSIDAMTRWGGGFMNSITTHAKLSDQIGNGLLWVTTDMDTVAEEKTSDFVKIMGLVDVANGVAPRIESNNHQWIHPNLDLQIHMHRLPVGQWLGIEAIQQIGCDGIGLTSAVLHDVKGAFGRSEQILTVREG